MDKEIRPSIFKRLVALILDFIILGIIGYISGLFLEDFYVSLGKYGTLLGSTITILYFSMLQSSIGTGQTIGKKIIGAKVVNLQGDYLSLDKSFLRSFIVFFPIMNLEIFSGGKGMLIVVILLGLTVFASFYFILVNKSRRCLHDLLVKSIVVNHDISQIEIDEQNDHTKTKLIPLGLIAFLIVGMGVYQAFSENRLGQLLTVKEKIEKVEGVITVKEVKSSTTKYTSSTEPSKTYSAIQVTVRIDDKEEASNLESTYFDTFYQIIKDEVHESQNVDGISITLYYGYNIGIASKSQSVSKTFENTKP